MLFSWLLARHHGGKFLFRVEDTDRTRLVRDSVQSMVEDFTWLGLDIDAGPTAEELHAAGYGWDGAKGFPAAEIPSIQSLRLPRYREVAEQLIRDGFAYRCDCSPERLEAERMSQEARGEPTGYGGFCRTRNIAATTPHVVRFLIPDGTVVVFQDAIRGAIRWDPVILRDMVILKTDGFPTYHLGAAVDDHDTGITHVLRGEEWISTTPLHCLVYRALGWTPPVIGHLPVILGSDGKKLSKRHGATNCKTFREEGYLPHALLNFLLLNGWSPGEGNEKEIYTLDEMVEQFSLERVHSAPAVFSFEKLQWVNGVYLRNMPTDALVPMIEPLLVEQGLTPDVTRLRAIMPYVRDRLTTSLKDAIPQVDFLFVDRVPLTGKRILELNITAAQATEIFRSAEAALQHLSPFEPHEIEQALRPIPQSLGVGKKPVFMSIRLAITGRTATPPLFECIAILGREGSLKRLRDAASTVVHD